MALRMARPDNNRRACSSSFKCTGSRLIHSLAAHHTGQAQAQMLHAVFPLQQGGDGEDRALVAQNGFHDAPHGQRHSVIGRALAWMMA